MTVLLVDDERLPLEDMRQALEPAGFSIDITTDPCEALKMYRRKRYNVVVSDVRMPGMDGITLLKKLREEDPGARVIIVTAYGDLDTAKAAINNRAYAFFGKPVSFPELIETLHSIPHDTPAASPEDVERLRRENQRLQKVYQDLVDEVRELQGHIR